MLDKRTEAMLRVANTLTAEDLDVLRGLTTMPPDDDPAEEPEPALAEEAPADAEKAPPMNVIFAPSGENSLTRGEYERQRTRESKVSTSCLGKQREGHNWWPVGTELIGQIGKEEFTAVVVENPAVKSGRSIRITSGQAAGRICLTPTRAAIEATEDYRQAHNMGRGGGITNGWEFWKPKA